MKMRFCLVGLVLFLCSLSRAQQAISLMEPQKPAQGWLFGNGMEFGGAGGGLSADATAKYNGKDSLKLHGDFSQKGKYVQAGRDIPDVDVKDISLWVKNPDADTFTLRINDASGQTHQIVVKTEAGEQWQRVVLPLDRFFANRGQANAVANIAKYEYWGGAKDGNWHGPAKAIYLIAGVSGEKKTRTLWVQDVTLTPRAPQAPATQIVSEVALDEILEGQHYWRLDFPPPGKGSLEVVKDQPEAGQSALKFSGDFTAGGAYVAMVKDLKELELADVSVIRVMMKSDNVQSIGVQLADGTGQTHQKKGIPITADGKWHEVILKPSEIAGIEHWGGANDGKWHAGLNGVVFNMNAAAGKDTKQPVLYIANLRGEALQRAVVQPPAFKADFETLPADGWTLGGEVSVDTANAFKGKNSLLIKRVIGQTNNEKPIIATSRTFAVTSGQWQIGAASKADLNSADASYSGVVDLEILDGAGKTLQSVTLIDTFGQRNWQGVSKTVEVPKGAQAARFAVRVNKAAGQFWADELSASFLAPAAKKDKRIDRLVLGTAAWGNLLLPTEARKMQVSLQAIKPLRDNQRTLTYVVRDYWGAEQTKAATITLENKGKKGDKFAYEGEIDLANAPLEIGRYYEVHASVPQEGDEPFKNYTSLAILPDAVTKGYKPEEIPFTSRSWDNRPEAHVQLTNRIGIRICGLWGGWDAKAPYKPNAPQIELVEKLGMGWLTGTAAHSIEQGKKEYDETALRQGVRNLIEKYGKVRPMIVNLGNEPHGTGQQVLDNVAAYKAIYEEIKKVDPTIFVVATSVEPNEEYFKAGYGKYCDAYDFHIYESAENVRKTMREYRALMKKYDVVHPIWSTEVGLNSQGMTRHAVACEVVKKFAGFFAEGGSSISWFGLMYPDGDGKAAGTSGEAHNIFDARYNKYAPKLDAIANYNMINGIAIKKFVAEKTYGDVRSFLMRDRDGKNLMIFWKEQGRADVSLPLPGVREVQAIRIDGTRRTLNAEGKALTISLDSDPLLLLFDGPAALPDTLGKPALSLQNPPSTVLRGSKTAFNIELNTVTAESVNLIAPPNWDVQKIKTLAGKTGVQFTVTAPEESEIREADFTITQGEGANRSAELYFRAPVAGKLALRVLPEPASGDKPAGVRLAVTNNSREAQQVSWDLALNQERGLANGDFVVAAAPSAYFAEAATGALTIAGGQTAQVTVPLANFDPLKIYRVRGAITDANGRVLSNERPVGGFVKVPRAKTAPKLDGDLNDGIWQNAPVQKLDKLEQFFKVGGDAAPWKGAQDLSSTLQFAWDDKFLYIAANVTDDVAGNGKEDSMIWAQDGLQFLIDPAREAAEKPGKYDYGVALSKKGPQSWRFLSADNALLTGEAKEIQVATKRGANGNLVYEVAFPWSSLVPFKPALGANLGLTMAINEDDGPGRKSFITWFGNAHSKQVDTVGDLILGE